MRIADDFLTANGWRSSMAEDKKKDEIAVIDITEEYLKERIYEIRGQRVILDADLSEIYGYTTKAFNQQVKIILRNLMKILCLNLRMTR